MSGSQLNLHCRIAPLDGKFPGVESEYQTLIDLYKLPDEFVWERERGVTHSFGHQLGEDGHESEYNPTRISA